MPRISELDLAPSGPLTGAELVPVVRDGVTVQTTAQDIANLSAAGSGVTSVNGDTGPAVVLNAAEVGATVDPSLVSPVSGLSGDEILTVEQGGNPVMATTRQIAELARSTESIIVACSDETTALTTGVAKVTFHIPYNFYVDEVFAGLTTPQTSGSIFTVDINDGLDSILTTKVTIDNTEETSLTATTPPVISDQTLLKGTKMTIDIDQVGDGTAAGLKVYIIGRRLA